MNHKHATGLPVTSSLPREISLSTGTRAVAIAVASALCGGALAQQAPVEEVTVTGSRIRATGFSTPTPVTAVSSEELEFMAPGNMIEAVSQLPIFFNNTTQDNPGNFFGSPGSGSLNIRGLNPNRTLTLLNGRRMPPSNRIGAVDINAFPEVMVERIEVVTGGASAAYGTDAVAGVANFILNTEYEGFDTHVQTGDTSSNGRETWEIGAAFGTELGERHHLIVSFDRYHQDGVYGYDSQDWYEAWGQVRTPAPGAPQLDAVVPNVVSTVGTQHGVISAPGTSIDRLEFLPDGSVRPFELGDPASVAFGSHSIAGGGSGTSNGTERATLSPEAERESAFLYYDFDLNDSTKLYAQMIYGQNSSLSNNNGGVFTGGNVLTVFSGNAYLPEAVQQIMDAENIESFQFQRFGSAADLAAGAQQHTRNTSRALTLGFEKDFVGGGFLEGWQLRGYAQAGRTEHRGNHINGVRIDRMPAALDAVVDDATGEIVCRAALLDPANWSDCVPVNLFGAGNASQEAIEYLTGLDAGIHVSTPVYFTDGGTSAGITLDYVSSESKLTLAEVEQDVVEFSLDGPIAEGWAGPIAAGFGVHYREESILQLTYDHTNPSGAFDSRPAMFDPDIVRGIPSGMGARTTGVQFASVPNINGGFDVKEAFAEFIVPLVADRPAVDQLTATLATRWADYSGSGDIQAWKYGLDWQVNDALRVRTTLSRDVRAATLAERFDRTGGIQNIEDPMFNERRDTSAATGGNPNLNPEEADTKTLGVIYQPVAVPGFQASIDWYEIDITGAVGQLGAQAIIDECFQFPTSSACELMNRDPDDNNRITIVEDIFVNINAARASGVDLETVYRSDVGPGSLMWRFLATRLNENSTTNLGAPKLDRAGEVGIGQFPELKFTTSLTYNVSSFSAFLQVRHIDSGVFDARDIEGVTITDNSVDSVTYTDLRLSYGRDAGNGRWEVFGNVTNLFDEAPPVAADFSNFTGTAGQVNAGLHDLLGRRYTIGFRYQL